MWLTYLFVVFTSLSLTAGQTCVKRDRCSCVYDDGTGMIDLSSIGNTDGTPMFLDYTAAVDQFWYSYNPCYPFNEGTCQDVAGCQYAYGLGAYYDIGNVDSTEFAFNGLTTDVTYKSADGARQTIVSLVCDPAQTTPFLAVTGEQIPGYYSMSLTAAAACKVPAPLEESGGMSGGSVLLITFFVVTTVYLIAGGVYNKVRLQASGKELVPNITFWQAIPGLIKGGFIFAKLLFSRHVLRRPGYEDV